MNHNQANKNSVSNFSIHQVGSKASEDSSQNQSSVGLEVLRPHELLHVVAWIRAVKVVQTTDSAPSHIISTLTLSKDTPVDLAVIVKFRR